MKTITKLLMTVISAVLLLFSVAITSSALSAPSLKLSNVKNGVKLTWTKAKGAEKYIIYKKSPNAKSFKVLKTLKKAYSFTDKNVKTGKKYSYRITAEKGGVNTISKTESIVRLEAVSSLKVKMKKYLDIFEYDSEYAMYNDPRREYVNELTFKTVKGAEKYEIYRAKVTKGKVGAYKKIGKSRKGLFYDFPKVGVNFKYKVRAATDSSKGLFSAASKKFGYMKAANIISIGNIRDEGFGIRWSGCKEAKGYKIYRSVDNGKTYKMIKDYTDFQTIDYGVVFKDTDVKRGQVYYYYVVAYNSETTQFSSDIDKCRALYKDYDVCVKKGESEPYYPLTALYNEYNTEGSELTLTSDNENIVKAEVEKSGSGESKVLLKGVGEGLATVTFKAFEDDRKLIVDSFKVYVTDGQVYDAVFFKNSTTNLYFLDEKLSLSMWSDNFKYNVTSDNEKVVQVISPEHPGFVLKGLSPGEAVVNLKINDGEKEIVNKNYRILITDYI